MAARSQSRAAATRQGIRRVLRRIALRPGRVDEVQGRRDELAIRFLHGDGIEIGALIHPLWVPPGVRVRYVDYMGGAELLDAAGEVYPNLDGAVDVDVVDDVNRLTKFDDGSVDFVIANHVLEHLEDPATPLHNWVRVLRPGGVLMVSLPDPRYSFDGPRGRTTVEHVLRDLREGPEVSRHEHLSEYARVVEGILDEESLVGRVDELDKQRWSIHFHVWELEGFLQLLMALNLPVRLELAQAVEPEFTVILRKN
jgi:predicted SAM-dependent methyltransferase